MILTEAQAIDKICEPLSRNMRRPCYRTDDMPKCVASMCMAHWKWNDVTKTEGYCSYDTNATDKPKIK